MVLTDYKQVVQMAAEANMKCEKACRMATPSAKESSSLCDKALGKNSSVNIRRLMREVEQVTKDAKDATLITIDALAQVRNAKNRIKEASEQLGLVESTADRRELGMTSSDVAERLILLRALWYKT